MSIHEPAHLAQSTASRPSYSYLPPRGSSSSSPPYVLKLSLFSQSDSGNSNPPQLAALTSATTQSIHLLDLTNNALRTTCAFDGHQGGTTSIRTVPPQNGVTLLSTGKDGLVHGWDARDPSRPVVTLQQLPGKKRALLCVDISSNGQLVGSGSEFAGDDAVISFWDPRSPGTPLRTHAETHSDDITALHFAPAGFPPPPPDDDDEGNDAMSTDRKAEDLVLTASTDGLLALSSVLEEEDDALLAASNWGSSVAQVGVIPSPSNATSSDWGIWASSDMETFSIWAPTLDQKVGEADLRIPAVRREKEGWVTDYFVTAHTGIVPSSGTFHVLVGTNEGDLSLLSPHSSKLEEDGWTMQGRWNSGHAGIIRDAVVGGSNDVLFTGGEDGRICVWPFVGQGGVARASDADGDVDMEAGTKRSHGGYTSGDGKRRRY